MKTREEKLHKQYVKDGMALPEGKICSNCIFWKSCKAMIYTLNPENKHCDFAPSRFREANNE